MSKHRTERSARDVVVDRIRSRVADLTEPSTVVVGQWVPEIVLRFPFRDVVRRTGRLILQHTNINHPSLLLQLRAGIAGSTAGVSSSGPASRPPTTLEPLAALQTIDVETRVWVRALGLDCHPSIAARLVALARRAPALDERLSALDADVRTWWVHARTVTTWGDPPIRPHIPCPDCGTWGRINVRLTPTTAACLECGAAWDGTTIGALGEHVQLALSPAIDLEAERAMIGPELPTSLVKVPRSRRVQTEILRGAPLA